ncbi:MAG: hypothetical protein COA86_16810 [Kangiella sp.]|nr:MAG: hypothetical protein COA86_16810 [Kangiella sp.]
MNKLNQVDNVFTITQKVVFNPVESFKKSTILKVFEFAYDMSFGAEGQHRDHRTGGKHMRANGEIFINAFQGKLSEIAVLRLIYKQYPKEEYINLPKPDFETYGLGLWDDCDLSINGKRLSIKSTKFYGNLLLLEKDDWNIHGQYIPNIDLSTLFGTLNYTTFCIAS